MRLAAVAGDGDRGAKAHMDRPVTPQRAKVADQFAIAPEIRLHRHRYNADARFARQLDGQGVKGFRVAILAAG